MSKFLDAMDKFFWTLFKIAMWILMFVVGWIIGDHIYEKYL